MEAQTEKCETNSVGGRKNIFMFSDKKKIQIIFSTSLKYGELKQTKIREIQIQFQNGVLLE